MSQQQLIYRGSLGAGPLLISSTSRGLAHATLGRRDFKFATGKHVGGSWRNQETAWHTLNRDTANRGMSEMF